MVAVRYQELLRSAKADPTDAEDRTAAICSDVATAARRGRRCLVLTERRDHLDAIADGLTEAGCHPQVLVGGVGKRARAEVLDRANELAPDDGFVLVATGRYIGEGFDCPPLDTLFLAFPISFRGSVVQYPDGSCVQPPANRTPSCTTTQTSACRSSRACSTDG